jgi:hypothetical protein
VVLVRTTFFHPEPSFTYNAGDPNIFSAISAGELDSDHHPPERLQGWAFLDPLSLTRLPVAAPVSPA